MPVLSVVEGPPLGWAWESSQWINIQTYFPSSVCSKSFIRIIHHFVDHRVR